MHKLDYVAHVGAGRTLLDYMFDNIVDRIADKIVDNSVDNVVDDVPPHPLGAGIAIECGVCENGMDAGAVGIGDFETKRFVSLQDWGISWKSMEMRVLRAAVVRQKPTLREFEATPSRKPPTPPPLSKQTRCSIVINHEIIKNNENQA